MSIAHPMKNVTESFELQSSRQRHSFSNATDSQYDFPAHGDDAAGENWSLSSSTSSTIPEWEVYTPDEEKAVLRKFDLHVVLFMSFLYLLSFLDRSNIGNAKIAGLSRDLQLSDSQFEWLLTAFYITYILFEWMILLYHILTPHVYISICVLSWGIIASLQALSTGFVSMLVLRTLLGISEAAFSPGVPFYLSFFFRREELAVRAGIQVSAAPLAASFAGSLAWVITRLGQQGPLAPWRLLFLVEGFPSIVVAVIAWSLVPDSPETARFLTPRERNIARHRLISRYRSGSPGHDLGQSDAGPVTTKRVEWRDIVETIKDPKCYLTALMFLNCNIAFSSMPVFLPSVVNEMGYSSISSQGLSAPPFLVAFFAVLITAKASDSFATRSPFVCFHALLGFIGYALIAAGGWLKWPNVVRYLCVYPAAAGFFSAITIIITWTMNNQQSNAKKGTGMTILNVIGQCGPLIGTRLYPDSDKPYYIRGMSVCALAMLIVLVLALVLRLVLIRENRRNAAREVHLDEAEAEPLASTKPVPPERTFNLLNMRLHIVSAALLTSFWSSTCAAVEPAPAKGDKQQPLKHVDRARQEVVCPDYSQYSKYALHGPFSDGPMGLPFQRPSPYCRTFESPLVEKVISDMNKRMIDKDLARVFENAFPNTLDTTVKWHVDGGKKKGSKKPGDNRWQGAQSFIVTGDINAEWLRDSTNQLAQYQPLAKKDTAIHKLILGAINTQAEYVITSPYCNAFQPPPPSHIGPTSNGQGDRVHPSFEGSFVFECKYEIDSLAAFLSLTNQFYNSTGSKEHLTKRWFLALETILAVLDEQSMGTFDYRTGSFVRSEYTFQRETTAGTETLNLGGVGNPIAGGTGLVRSAFRPSDDATILPFFIPGNAMMSVELKRSARMLEKEGYSEIARNLNGRSDAIRSGIYQHGVVNHKTYGDVFAFEVDGYGSAIMMDDANLPSLLALPTLGFVAVDDEIYQNTRNMILEKDGNPYYLTGRSFQGIGGPHIGPTHAWPMSLLVQIMTSENDDEIETSLALVKKTCNLGLIHESVNVNSVRDYTRRIVSAALAQNSIKNRPRNDFEHPRERGGVLQLVYVPNGWGTGFTPMYAFVPDHEDEVNSAPWVLPPEVHQWPAQPAVAQPTGVQAIRILKTPSAHPGSGQSGIPLPVIDQVGDFYTWYKSPYPALEDAVNSKAIGRGGTPFPFDKYMLALHRDVYAPAKNPPNDHWSTVVQFLEEHNDPRRRLTNDEKAALRRLQDLGKLPMWRADIMFKIFLDCDLIFFAGRLKHNVYLKCIIDPHMNAGGLTYPAGGAGVRVTIAFPFGPTIEKTSVVHEVIGTLLHEMCHAVLSVYCGWEGAVTTLDARKERAQPKFDAGHAEAFTRVMYAVQRRLGPTRYIRLGHKMYEPGGTVDIYSELGQDWMKRGGFRCGKGPE
ncbi:MAG: hypothetical protein M1828_003409 [Chrysothrix sp. TS-e1954]|nr:MAG: hypothetical protein M1828_003409 [Chrysothrix sp. TS-e1954]